MYTTDTQSLQRTSQNERLEIVSSPHETMFFYVRHFAIALRAYCNVYTKWENPKIKKSWWNYVQHSLPLSPLKILEQKAIAPLRGALTETSTKTTHRWNLQSPHYLRSRSSFQTIAFENPDWPTHPILCRLLKREISDFFSLTLCCNSLGCFT